MRKFLLAALTLVGASAFLSAHAQTVSRIALGEARVSAKSETKLSVEYAVSSGSAWCELEVDWGNGNKRDIRVGDGDAARSPFTLGHIYDNPGTYTIRVQGRFLSRGLKSAQPCQVSAQSISVIVFDAIAEQQQKETEERLATREREAAEREKRAQEEAAKAKAEQEAIKLDVIERKLELMRKEIELKEAELKQREQELQRKTADPKANPARTIAEKATPSAPPPANSAVAPSSPVPPKPVAPPADTATPTVRYLGLRLLDLVQPDPKVSPLPTALAQGLKECRFTKDEDNNQTKSEKCVIRDLAPTYKQRPKEELKITAETPRCCLGAVTINPNQLTYEETLNLFEGIPGVKKTPEACKNIEAEYGRQEFFTISKDGKNKFTIKEVTDGGSGGSQTTTTIYYGMPTVDCKAIASIEKLQSDRIREANLKSSQRSSQVSSQTRPSKPQQNESISNDRATYCLLVSAAVIGGLGGTKDPDLKPVLDAAVLTAAAYTNYITTFYANQNDPNINQIKTQIKSMSPTQLFEAFGNCGADPRVKKYFNQ